MRRGNTTLNRLKIPYNRPSFIVITYLFIELFIKLFFALCYVAITLINDMFPKKTLLKKTLRICLSI